MRGTVNVETPLGGEFEYETVTLVLAGGFATVITVEPEKLAAGEGNGSVRVPDVAGTDVLSANGDGVGSGGAVTAGVGVAVGAAVAVGTGVAGSDPPPVDPPPPPHPATMMAIAKRYAERVMTHTLPSLRRRGYAGKPYPRVRVT